MITGIDSREDKQNLDFIDYWDSLGFFDNIRAVLPPQFFILFDIARMIFTDEASADALEAIEDISREEKVYQPDRDESIQVNRVEKIAPLSDIMELDTFRSINELKKALPRELAQDDDMFNVKLLTKSLIVQKFYETESDRFKPVSTSRDRTGKDANRFEQKFYILLDRSKSMEYKMRSFYSKCIVAEFLRRKLNSKAMLFYRPFDTKPGRLTRVEKIEDFPLLIERILLTTTGGKSTNLEAAISQAISDINYDKEMMKSEILIVTDGISKIDRNKMKIMLGDIKLNVLKIGDELAEPDYFDMEAFLRNENINFDPSSINIRDVKDEVHRIKNNESDSTLSLTQKRAYRFIWDYSEKMFKDLRELAYKYIEIGDMHNDDLFKVTDENMSRIKESIENFNTADISDLDIDGKTRLYKQVSFLAQYVQMLIENGNQEHAELNRSLDRLQDIRNRMIKDPDLLFTIINVKELCEDKKTMKLARKEARMLMKNMQLENRKLSIDEMKKGQVFLTMDVGEGSMGQFLLLLMIKAAQFIRGLFDKAVEPLKRKSKPSDDEEEESDAQD